MDKEMPNLEGARSERERLERELIVCQNDLDDAQGQLTTQLKNLQNGNGLYVQEVHKAAAEQVNHYKFRKEELEERLKNFDSDTL